MKLRSACSLICLLGCVVAAAYGQQDETNGAGEAAAQDEAGSAAVAESEPAATATDEPPVADGAEHTIPVQTIRKEEPAEPGREATAESGTRLDTIEVTASKRVKSQRDIPGSVGAIRGQDLEKIRAQGMEDYVKLIPGVYLADFGTGAQIPVIRGIAASTNVIGSFTGLTTGIFLDDMPFNDLFLPLSVPDLNPFDLERVEVLKGPQGTLFGSGALAGAVRYIVQKPNLSVWQAKASATVTQTKFAEDLSKVGAAAVNVPLFGDTAALRLVGVYRKDAGLYDALPNGGNTRDEKDINRLDQITGRVIGRWDVTDALKVSALYFRQATDQPDRGHANQPERPERNDIPFPSPFETGFGGGNLSADYDLDWSRLLYSANVLDKDVYSRGQNEPALPDQLGNQQDASWYALITGTVKGSTHELRLSSPEGGDDSDWEWLVGAAYMNYVQDFFQFSPNPGPAGQGYYANPPENPEDVAPADRPTSFLWATIDGDGTETALFGEATRRLGEHWEATLGARAFNTKLISEAVFTGEQIVLLGDGETEQRDRYLVKERGINPKVSLRYLHDRNIQAYVLMSKGFQFGGFQITPSIGGIEQASENEGFTFGPYKSSTLWNYEAGLRTEWLDRRLRFDLTAFYLDWTDLQLTIQVPINPVPIPAPPGSGIPQDVSLEVIANVGAAHSEGLEASLEVLPFTGAKFTSSAAWINAVTDVPFDEKNDDGPVPAGTRLPGAPRFQWVNVLAYEHALPYFTSWIGDFALTHVHVGTSPDSIRRTLDVGGYDTLDVRLNLARPGAPLLPEIGLGVNNLTDVRGLAAFDTDGSAYNAFYLVRPRTTLLTLAWNF